MNRRKFFIGTMGVLAAAGGVGWYLATKKAAIGFDVNEETIVKGRELLKSIICADLHAHPGRSFVEGGINSGLKLKMYTKMGSFEEDTIADMLKGGITMSSFSTVADYNLLEISDKGISAVREFNTGEAWRSYQTQIATLKELENNKDIAKILSPGDVIKAKEDNKIGMFLTSEGGDFLEGNLENLDICYADGLRSITIMHYHINEIGDIQTQAPKYNTLTPFGIALVQAMNKKGMIVDLAHAAKNTLLKAVEVSTKPVMVSHTSIRGKGFDFPRFISVDEAQAVKQNGGIIGIWPSGFGLLTLSDYIDQIFRQIDIVGIDHIAIGTDMDSNYKPVFDDYKRTPLLAGTLLERGLSKQEAAKVLGGNFMRVFKEVTN